MTENIYEITKVMSNNQALSGDLQNGLHMVKEQLLAKYIKPVKTIIAKEQTKIRKNPSSEIRLLEALKPFIPHTQHDKLTQTMNTLYTLETIKRLTTPVPKTINHNQIGIQSLSQDGVYEIDEKCMKMSEMPRISPIFLVLALMAVGE